MRPRLIFGRFPGRCAEAFTPSIGWSADNLDALTASAQIAVAASREEDGYLEVVESVVGHVADVTPVVTRTSGY